MGRLVNTMRQKSLNQTGEIDAQLQNNTLNQAINQNTTYMIMVRRRNAWNVFDVLAMSYEAVYFPGRFAATKDMWGDMVTKGPRYVALNVLLTLPTIIMISK